MLCSAGISNTFINAMKAIYGKVLSCVRVNGEFTDMFDCPQGLRQGCVLSPTLFSIVINEITKRGKRRKARYTAAPWLDRAFHFALR